MVNIQTWHRICLSAYLIFPSILAVWMLPKDSPWQLAAIIGIGWGLFIAVTGAVIGVIFTFGKLRFGCPRCHAPSLATGGGRTMGLQCPRCGILELQPGRLSGLYVQPKKRPSQLAEKLRLAPISPLLAPMRHWFAFSIIFSPVVASVIAASVIHRFSFIYLLIPGFWCYAVGGFIIAAIASGQISDNQGTATRTQSPLRFWSKVGLWSLFYLFAAASPIGIALQESAK
ncbi:hypothetical protein [Sulfuriroseicoccus oceanibius]|uniref:Uncharacterized protein n=1 Tax=Sulfuriroseicoccus oceanibius TaxID=2707525 RepID=A0A7T7JBZ1_9BACT|nr:hypothetical protein [Sulfuriroseicoccus oceanibius]QQL44559.1 hypothetical protein G3M56_011810 [Sulfuriroseicoccus oceanibius]